MADSSPSEPSDPREPFPGSTSGIPAAGAEDPLPEEAAVKRVRNSLLALAGGVVLAVAAITLFSTRDGWGYYLRDDEPQRLGRVEEAASEGRLAHNRFVTLTGRPILESEGGARVPDAPPGCLSGPQKQVYFTLLAETGDQVVVRTTEKLRGQELPRRTRFTGRLLRFESLPETMQIYKKFLLKLTDCRSRPETCERSLLVGADIPPEEILSKTGRTDITLNSREGHHILAVPMTPIFILLEFPGQYEYRVIKEGREEAIRRVKALGVPWIHVEESGQNQGFIIQAPEAIAQRITKKQRRGCGYSISRRTASYLTTWGNLRNRDGDLVIQNVGPGFPEKYRVVRPPRDARAAGDARDPGVPPRRPSRGEDSRPAPPDDSRPAPPDDSRPAPPDDSRPAPPDDSRPAPPDDSRPAPPREARPGSVAPPRLVLIKRDSTEVLVPRKQFLKASYHGPRRLPDTAWLLVTGRRPAEAWPATVVAAGCLAVAGVGLLLILLGLRRPRRA